MAVYENWSKRHKDVRHGSGKNWEREEGTNFKSDLGRSGKESPYQRRQSLS